MAKAKPLSEDFSSGFDIYREDGFSRFTGTLSGADWYGDYLRLFNWDVKGSKTVLSDADAGEGRLIGHLALGWNSDVDLISTTVHMITGANGNLHDVTLGSGYLAYMRLTAATNKVTTGSGHYEYIFLSGAKNTVTTGDGMVGVLVTRGSGKIDIGAGGAGTIWTGDGDDLVTTAAGVGSIQTGDGNDRVTTAAGVGSIETGDGEDRVVLKDSANLVRTGAGDDVVITSGQWIERVNLGAGDDTVVVKALDAWFELGIVASSNPKNGSDTLNFSKLKTGVTFELGKSGAWQDVYKSKKLDAWVSETGIENVIGTRKKDVLTDGSLDNQLTGGKGADVFVFGKNGGNDTVTDFEVGTDILRIKGHKGGFAALEIKDGDIVLDGGVVDLAGVNASDLTAESFYFV